MRYDPITEKPYCCVPAVLQMILTRRGLPCTTQDDIGWDLGLIVPPEAVPEFTAVRTGPMPRAGYGTRTSKPEFSIESYFDRRRLPLSITRVSPASPDEMISRIEDGFTQGDDIVLCFNSQVLFGDGDIEHVALIESFTIDSGRVTVIDPAIGAPKRRNTTSAAIFETIRNHDASAIGGLWIISSRKTSHKERSNRE